MSSEFRVPGSEWATAVIVALGSNLGDSPSLVRQAIQRLAPLSDQPIRASSLWRTQPVDCPPGAPSFVNAVVAFQPRPSETPESLLDKLQALEREFGRPSQRARNQPRSLDLDLIAFGREVRSGPALTLPHPRAHLRRFVLEPLSEIAPALVLPGQSARVRDLLMTLSGGELLTCLGTP